MADNTAQNVPRRRSLSVRLLLIFLLTGLALLILLHMAFRGAVDKEVGKTLQNAVAEYGLYLRDQMGSPVDYDRARRVAERTGLVISVRDQRGFWSSAPDQDAIADFRFRPTDFPQVTYRVFRGTGYVRVKRDDDAVYFTALHHRRLDNLETRSWVAIGLMLAVIALSYHLVRRLFSPINTMHHAAIRFGNGDLNHRITSHRDDELGQLSNVFNHMAKKIQQMLETKRQLLLAISHELRSPLTRMRVAAELTDIFDNEKNAKVREILINDIREMEQLLAELLESERLEMATGALPRLQCDLPALINELVRDHYSAADHIELVLEPVPALDLEPASMKLMIRNLLSNAVKYGDKKPVTLSLSTTDNELVMVVTDRGKGVGREHIPFLTEPFYRVDPARQRQTGGYGLGLYLCKLVATAHGGDIQIESKKGVGTSVKVRLPLGAGR